MSSSEIDRQKKLGRFFIAALRDKTKISSSRQAQLFIEALCTTDDIAELAAQIIDFPQGRDALNLAVRQDISADFVSEHTVKLLQCLSSSDLAAINQGQTKRDILGALLRPSFFFVACLGLLEQRLLPADASCHVAWFVSEAVLLFSNDEMAVRLPALSDSTLIESLLSSESPALRAHGYSIKRKVQQILDGDTIEAVADGPGGRHDNDASAIRDIALLPTQDEILSSQPAFLKTAKEVFAADPELRSHAAYRDHLFRLLREDLVYTFRECLQHTYSGRKRSLFAVTSTEVTSISADDTALVKPWGWQPWALQFRAPTAIAGTETMTAPQRFKFLRDFKGRGSKILRGGTLMAVCCNGAIVGFGQVKRDVDKLSLNQPLICLQLNADSVLAVLARVRSDSLFDLIQIDSPVFAYEPFLKRLQDMPELEFSNLLLGKVDPHSSHLTHPIIDSMIDAATTNNSKRLSKLFGKPSLSLDASQCSALATGLSSRVAILQGPPGTGKSFIGSLIARALHDHLKGPILVVCFTNHALDQFTEDLMDMGIRDDSIVRLGSKSSSKTEPLLLRSQQRAARLTSAQWTAINEAKSSLTFYKSRLIRKLENLKSTVSAEEVLSHLEFLDNTMFYDGLCVPDSRDGMTIVGRDGKAVGSSYLLDRWRSGADGGIFKSHPSISDSPVWNQPIETRTSLYHAWTAAIRSEAINDARASGLSYDSTVKRTRDAFRSLDAAILGQKSIIACTSTQAAMSADILSRVQPETVLLEEAGELLEPHVLTTLGASTKRLIMIGDEKQLRPKIANYALSVEVGSGFDLNRSLFERLILEGMDHVSLTKQHRMRPEISDLVRHMTYPGLEDAPSTLNRAPIKGLQRNVVFVSHHEPELVRRDVIERQMGSSKQNPHEAMLALRYVKYLAQQGYKSEDMVVLTPYMAQLRLLQDTLSRENDAILNDLDSQDLYRAGLLDSTAAKSSGRQILISSIDNYQGEERKIVIISLTRSNENGNIGFMAEPERLNVLLSRARDGMIVIGNFDTFTASEKGARVWRRLWSFANEQGYIWSGLPIQCQTHQDVKAIVTNPDDFLTLCPDGGCSKPCGVTLPCGKHTCPSRCHLDMDHSKYICTEVIKSKCDQGHVLARPCNSQALSECLTCRKQDEKRRRTAKKLLDQNDRSEASRQKHDREMENLDDEIKVVQEEMANMHAEQEQAKALAVKRDDLRKARAQLQKKHEKPKGPTHPSKQANQTESSTSQNAQSAPEPAPSKALSTLKSKAKDEWERQKRVDGQFNDAIDDLMGLVGLENVKNHILDLKGQIETKKRQGIDLTGERMHVSFLGNPGTGKTTVARLWARLLCSLEVIEGDAFEETTGSKLASEGIPAAKKHLDNLQKADGGVFFVDEAYQLTSGGNSNGRIVLDFLLAEIENRRGTIVFVFAGYKQPMETFYGHNPGIPSRVPHLFEFHDYEEQELLTMLQVLFEKRYKSGARIEDGPEGLYMRIVARRLSRHCGNEGFGNMRDLENLFALICRRQSRRIAEARRDGTAPDDFEFLAGDLIGPEPSKAVLESKAWKKLQNRIGLKEVKDSITTLVDILKTNHGRELQELEPVAVSLNKVFLGSPGTGKTTVAALYGQLLADIGLLSNGEVVLKTPADFIGSAMGVSEQNTHSILNSSKGKVLVIDEAYMFDSGSGTDCTGFVDPYRTAVIDTIVSQVHNTPGDDRCVLLLGYEDQMAAMFQRVNPGLSRRFPMEDAFRFEDLTDEELRQILRLKLSENQLEVTQEGENVAMDVLSRSRNNKHFGNAGEVENIITRAKTNRPRRKDPALERGEFVLDAVDFDPDFNRAGSAADRINDLFRDHVGFDMLTNQLKQYQKIAENVKKAGQKTEDHVPFNFIFKGPPGTGKTTTARKIGQVYYDMGLLQRVEVVESSVSDMVGQYVGQTGPKTTKLLEKALGKVLFVDEAYRLSEGLFASEAMNELTDLLTKPRFKGKLIVILAGYEDEMDGLLSVNPGLASRFAETVMFRSLSPSQCLELFIQQLRHNSLQCLSLNDKSSNEYTEATGLFQRLTELKYWGNGRDVQNLSKKAMRFIYGRDTTPEEDVAVIPFSIVAETLQNALTERLKTESRAGPSFSKPMLPLPQPDSLDPRNAVNPSFSVAHRTKEQAKKEDEISESEGVALPNGRDDGVSDETWNQLQADIAANAQQVRQGEGKLSKMSLQHAEAQQELRSQEKRLATLEAHDDNDSDSDSDEDDHTSKDEEDLERQKLMKQIAALRAERQRIEEARRQEEKRQEDKRQKEAAVQKKLAAMGVCCMGFQWIRQGSGYRCAGGSHFVSNVQLALGED